MKEANQEFEKEFAKQYKTSYEKYIQKAQNEIGSLLDKVPQESGDIVENQLGEDFDKFESLINPVTQEGLEKVATKIENSFTWYGKQLKKIPGEIGRGLGFGKKKQKSLKKRRNQRR